MSDILYEYNNLVLREITQEDLEPLRIMHNDPSTLYNLTDPTYVTEEMQQKWFEGLNKKSSSKRYVITEDDELIGFVRFDNIDMNNNNMCIGLDIMIEKRGQGYGKESYSLMFKYCFEILKMNMLWLYTADYNTIGINLYEKMGMKTCGTFPSMLYREGVYYDCILMYITKFMWMIKND